LGKNRGPKSGQKTYFRQLIQCLIQKQKGLIFNLIIKQILPAKVEFSKAGAASRIQNMDSMSPKVGQKIFGF